MSKILYLLRYEEQFEKVLKILRERSIYDKQVWAYAFKHGNNI